MDTHIKRFHMKHNIPEGQRLKCSNVGLMARGYIRKGRWGSCSGRSFHPSALIVIIAFAGSS
jgi:hypothetical protein